MLISHRWKTFIHSFIKSSLLTFFLSRLSLNFCPGGFWKDSCWSCSISVQLLWSAENKLPSCSLSVASPLAAPFGAEGLILSFSVPGKFVQCSLSNWFPIQCFYKAENRRYKSQLKFVACYKMLLRCVCQGGLPEHLKWFLDGLRSGTRLNANVLKLNGQ